MIYLTNKVNTSFTINDVIALSKCGENLVVLYEQQATIPDEIKEKATFVRLLPLGDRFSLTFFISHIIDYIRFLVGIPLHDWKKIFRLGGFKELLINYQNALHKSIELDEKVLRSEDTLLSFWFYDLIFPIILKRSGIINTLIARSHRGDTYEGEIGVRELWLRNYQFEHTNVLYPISKHGAQFLKNLYPKYQYKIQPLYLGSSRLFEPTNISTTTHRKTIVSCSWINNKKNVHLIPQLLKDSGIDFQWIHFGSGPKEWEDRLNAAIDQAGIRGRINLMGNTPNSDIQRFYADHRVDAFISLSSTEGVPVSFMEALSYGIPVFATDVGGNQEIITDYNGALVPYNDGRVKSYIPAFISFMQSEFDPMVIKNSWEDQFNIDVNNQVLLTGIKPN